MPFRLFDNVLSHIVCCRYVQYSLPRFRSSHRGLTTAYELVVITKFLVRAVLVDIVDELFDGARLLLPWDVVFCLLKGEMEEVELAFHDSKVDSFLGHPDRSLGTGQGKV